MFLREIVAKFIGSIVVTLTFGILLFMLIWDRDNQQVWDKIAGTIVVDDPDRLLE